MTELKFGPVALQVLRLGDEKIAAIGVSVRKWITGHGLALNVDNDLVLFDAIVPCGIREFGVTSMSRAGVTADPADVRARLVEAFVAVFPSTLNSREADVDVAGRQCGGDFLGRLSAT